MLDDKEFKNLLKETNKDTSVRIFDLIEDNLKKEIRQILMALRAVRDGKQIEKESKDETKDTIKEDSKNIAEDKEEDSTGNYEEISKLLKKIDIDAYGIAKEILKEEIKPYNPSTHKIYPCGPEVKKIPITVTTVQSSKGLDADYVFITYFDDKYFIEDDDKIKISDQDICKFIVALTRARKKVFLISSDKNKKPLFLNWIGINRIMEI